MTEPTTGDTDPTLEAMLATAIAQIHRDEPASPEQLAELARRVTEAGDPGQRLALGHAYALLLGPTNGAEVAQEWVMGDDPYLRDAGFEALTEFGAAALDEITALARDERREVRWYGVEAARLLDDPRAVPLLIDALADDDFAIRWAASRGLVGVGEAVREPLLDALVHQPATITFHRAALWTLRRLAAPDGQREAYRTLIESLSHSTTVFQSGPLAADLLHAIDGA